MLVLPMALAFGVASGLGRLRGCGRLWCGGRSCCVHLKRVTLVGGRSDGADNHPNPDYCSDHPLPDGSPNIVFIFTTIVLASFIFIVLGLLKLWQFIKFIPYSVISGFMTRLGFLYVLLQLNPFLGLPGAKTITAAITKLPSTITHIFLPAVTIGALTLRIVMIWPKIPPVTWLPGPFSLGCLSGRGLPHSWV